MTERQWMAGRFRKRKKEETQITDFKKQGKKNRKKGSEWEKIVRADLESKGWIVSKWQNQVEFMESKKYHRTERELQLYSYWCFKCSKKIFSYAGSLNARCPYCKGTVGKERIVEEGEELREGIGKIIPCRMNFRGKGIPIMLGAGFPDYIAINKDGYDIGTADNHKIVNEVIGVECKTNGYLNPEEREKCRWMIDQRIFSKILIGRKPKTAEELMTGERIIYEEFKNV